MSKYHRRVYDGTFASLSDSTAKLYSVIRFAKNHKTNICHYHDDTLISMTGQSNGTFYKAKKNLKELGIIDYDSHPGDSKQIIRYLHDVDMIKNTSINNSSIIDYNFNPYKYVYIIRYDTHVKIGKANNVQKRFSFLKGMSHIKIELLWYANETESINEQSLHDLFNKHRSHNEYFEYSAEIKDFIESHRNKEG